MDEAIESYREPAVSLVVRKEPKRMVRQFAKPPWRCPRCYETIHPDRDGTGTWDADLGLFRIACRREEKCGRVWYMRALEDSSWWSAVWRGFKALMGI